MPTPVHLQQYLNDYGQLAAYFSPAAAAVAAAASQSQGQRSAGIPPGVGIGSFFSQFHKQSEGIPGPFFLPGGKKSLKYANEDEHERSYPRSTVFVDFLL